MTLQTIEVARNQYSLRNGTHKFMFCRTGELTTATRLKAVWELYDQVEGYQTVHTVKVDSDLGSKLEHESALGEVTKWINDNYNIAV